jgi:hypothetical protein
MGKSIAIETNPQADPIEIDGTLVARGLGLAVPAFQQLMEDRKVTVLCERGTGDDAGLYRASFYHEGKRFRLVVDASGTPVPGDQREDD